LEFGVFASETLDPAGRVDEFMFAGEKRVALGAYLHPDVWLCGADLNGVAAGARGGGRKIFGMPLGFHNVCPPLI
jgi:hypothetical protein